jgi:hypothetical protein
MSSEGQAPRIRRRGAGGGAWVTYVGRHGAVAIAATGQVAEHGVPLEVPADLAGGLLAQTSNWAAGPADDDTPEEGEEE